MRVAVFFVTLCFLLLKGDHSDYAGTHYNGTSHISFRNIEKTSRVNFTDLNLDKKQESLICDEVEEDDANNLSARKYTLLAKCYLSLSYLFTLRYLYSCFKARSAFCAPLSYKYITQRVLRI